MQGGATDEEELGFELTAGQVIKKPSFKWQLPYPEKGSIYSFCFWKPEQIWKDWLLTVDNRPPHPEASYNDIIVPTLDTARYSFLLILLVVHQRHVLFCGPTGTGVLNLTKASKFILQRTMLSQFQLVYEAYYAFAYLPTLFFVMKNLRAVYLIH